MKRKGIDFRAAPHLTWREAQEGDLDSRGRQVTGGYFILLRTKDCLGDSGDFDQEKRQEAPQFQKLTYSLTNMAYGVWRKQTQGAHFWVRVRKPYTPREAREADEKGIELAPEHELQWRDVYWTCPIYWIENGYMYRASSRTYENPIKQKVAA